MKDVNFCINRFPILFFCDIIGYKHERYRNQNTKKKNFS